MYYTNKKALEKHKVREFNYSNKMQLLEKELNLKQTVLKYGSLTGLLIIFLLILA